MVRSLLTSFVEKKILCYNIKYNIMTKKKFLKKWKNS